MVIPIDTNVLTSYFLSKEGITSSGSAKTAASTGASGSTPAAPTAPWSGVPTPATTLATQVLNGQNIINPNAAQLSSAPAGSDYKSLFTAYQGLNALYGMTEKMLAATATTGSNTQIASAFTAGLAKVSSYVQGLQLKNLRLTTGSVSNSQSTTEAPAAENDTYTTGVIYTGSQDSEVPAFQGDVKFDINIKKYKGANLDVPIDLSQMGSTPRTMANVVNYINAQLKAAGVVTRFATDRLPSVPQTVQVGKKTVTLPAAPDQWALQVNGGSEEAVTFSAPSTAAAVYVAQTSGNTVQTSTAANPVTPPVQQLAKYQTGVSTTATPPPDALAQPGSANATSDEAFNKTLPSTVGAVHATATGPDGSVYLVADVTGTIAGQTPQGAGDVALLKYDSAGKLQYAQTLGASNTASGYSIAVAADGSVAVGGSVTGALDPNDPGNGATNTDSFVTLYDPTGQETWTKLGTNPANNQINAVAFGANNAVYVAGQSNFVTADSTTSGGTPQGFIAGYSKAGKSLFNTQTGTDNAVSLAVDGSTLVVAGTSGGDGVLNGYSLQASGVPTQTATRDLGSLGGGAISGVAINNGQVIVAGTTSNSALNAGTITSAASGGQDAFVAQLSESLAAGPGDRLAYFGGPGTDSATALTISGGQVYIAGSTTGGLPGLPAAGHKQGYVASVDVNAGVITWSQAIAGQDGYDAPESVAVAQGGASVLDRLGLPTQTLTHTSSQLLTSATSVRAGDQFQIRTSAGVTPTTITIDANDTPQTLEAKVQRATGFYVSVSVLPSGGKNELVIKAANNQATVELLPGKTGQDALAPLGLTAGVIQSAPSLGAGSVASSSPSGVAKNTYGLNIDGAFDLTTTAGIKAAQAVIKAATAKIQTAYYTLSQAGTSTSKTAAGTTNTSATTGKVPAYLQNQLANYQAGLTRLTAGSTSSGTSLASLL